VMTTRSLQRYHALRRAKSKLASKRMRILPPADEEVVAGMRTSPGCRASAQNCRLATVRMQAILRCTPNVCRAGAHAAALFCTSQARTAPRSPL
jgi:hypothetical protein